MPIRPALLLIACALAGCDDAAPPVVDSAAPVASDGNVLSAQSPATAAWDSTKTCTLLDRAAVAEVLGTAVTAADLTRVVPGNSATPAFSQCNYTLALGGAVEFYARQAPGPDNDAAAIAQARERSAAASPGGVSDVAGMGKAAYWASGLRQLHVFVSDDRYIYLTVPELPGRDPQADAAALYSRIAG